MRETQSLKEFLMDQDKTKKQVAKRRQSWPGQVSLRGSGINVDKQNLHRARKDEKDPGSKHKYVSQ